MLILASQSPRRRQLLQQLGVAFEVRKVDVPEVRQAGESAVGYVERVAREKGRAVLAELHDKPDAQVLSADTEVVLDDDVFGKPCDAAAASVMLRRLAGRTHSVVSVVWLLDRDHEASARCMSRVTFAALDEARIAAYVATGEPFDKAGGYAIQGRAAAFVERLEGSYSGVMGLPLFETAQLLRQAGEDGAM